jgi:hypothetical protein
MSFLLDKFCSFLPPNIASKYTTSELQQKLPNYFGNAIIVEKQHGQGHFPRNCQLTELN